MRTDTKNALSFVLFSTIVILLSIFLMQLKNASATHEKQTISENTVTVVLDAGHGGEDGGAVGKNGIYEKDLNLSLTKKIGDSLKDRGIDIKYTRTEDILLYDKNADFKNKKKALDLAERVKIAQSTENCIFVSIHMNSFSETKYSGLQVYYSKNNTLSRELATSVQTAVKNNLQPQNTRKAAMATSRIYILDRLSCPAILIECGFISNADECRLLCTDVYQNELSKIISQEIENYIKKIQKPY